MTRKNYVQGVLKSIRYTIDIKILDETKPIRLQHVVPAGTVSTLTPLLNRLTEQYKSLANDALDAGASIQGKDWKLSAKELEPNTRVQTGGVPLSDISAIDV